jgi:hypothetical protein
LLTIVWVGVLRCGGLVSIFTASAIGRLVDLQKMSYPRRSVCVGGSSRSGDLWSAWQAEAVMSVMLG